MTDEKLADALFNAWVALELAKDELPTGVDAQMQQDLLLARCYAERVQAMLEPYMERHPISAEPEPIPSRAQLDAAGIGELCPTCHYELDPAGFCGVCDAAKGAAA